MWPSEMQAGIRTGARTLSALTKAASPASRPWRGTGKPWKLATLVFSSCIVENPLSSVENVYLGYLYVDKQYHGERRKTTIWRRNTSPIVHTYRRTHKLLRHEEGVPFQHPVDIGDLTEVTCSDATTAERALNLN